MLSCSKFLLRPAEYDVIANTKPERRLHFPMRLQTQVGGIGIAPGANISDLYACFEATSTVRRRKYAGKELRKPGSLILSAEMMLRHMGWTEAATSSSNPWKRAIGDKVVTYDFARLMEGAKEVKCSAFGQAMN